MFARQVEAFGRPGDLLIGLSTSGNSANVLRAAQVARQASLTTLALTGAAGGALAEASDLCLKAPSTSTPRIQEIHILMGHIVCQIVEEAVC